MGIIMDEFMRARLGDCGISVLGNQTCSVKLEVASSSQVAEDIPECGV